MCFKKSIKVHTSRVILEEVTSHAWLSNIHKEGWGGRGWGHYWHHAPISSTNPPATIVWLHTNIAEGLFHGFPLLVIILHASNTGEWDGNETYNWQARLSRQQTSLRARHWGPYRRYLTLTFSNIHCWCPATCQSYCTQLKYKTEICFLWQSFPRETASLTPS